MVEVTQNELVLRALRLVGPAGLTPKQGLDLAGTMRLAARIKELRDTGYRIETRRVKVGESVVAQYVLHEERPSIRVIEEPVLGL